VTEKMLTRCVAAAIFFGIPRAGVASEGCRLQWSLVGARKLSCRGSDRYQSGIQDTILHSHRQTSQQYGRLEGYLGREGLLMYCGSVGKRKLRSAGDCEGWLQRERGRDWLGRAGRQWRAAARQSGRAASRRHTRRRTGESFGDGDGDGDGRCHTAT
jgi:hypothetical protein